MTAVLPADRLRPLARRLRRWARGRWLKGPVYRLVFLRLPPSPETVVFESQLGRVYGDSPKYVYEALRRSGIPRRAVWAIDGDRGQWPADVTVVRRDSWRYYYELARAGAWVDNQGFPAIARPRPQTVYLQTWHGSPLKVMGFDEPRMTSQPRRQRELATAVARWTHFVVQSEFAESAFARAYRHRAVTLRTGYPRNDPLLADTAGDRMAEVRKRLDLPADRRIVMYAPTFRDYLRDSGAAAELALDLDLAARRLGDRWFLLVRPHYLDRITLPDSIAGFARDVSAHPDVTELLLACDALVTDYSSLMFDFALLRRPMLFFAYDLERYLATRGTYFDLAAEAPGPVVTTQEAVIDWLESLDKLVVADSARHDAFVRKFCSFESGAAADLVVRQVFGAK